MYPPSRHLFHYYPDGYSENFSGVMHTTRICYSSFIELISTICLSQPVWLPVSSPPERKILASGDASLSLLSPESLAMYLARSRYLMNIYWMSKHLLRASVVHFIHIWMLITNLQVRYNDSYHPNKLSGTQIGEVTCSKLHSWWLMDSHLSV